MIQPNIPVLRFLLLLPALAILLVVGCSSENAKTKAALKASDDLAEQKNYKDALKTLSAAIDDRITDITTADPIDKTDAAARAAELKKILSDSEILKLERAEMPVVLELGDTLAVAKLNADLTNGDPSDHTLADAVSSGPVNARVEAVRSYTEIGDVKNVPILKSALQSGEDQIREAASSVLGNLKDSTAVDALLPALKDSDVVVRANAADALGLQRDIRAIGPLLDALADKDETVQLAAETSIRFLIDQPNVTAQDFVPHMTASDPHVALVAATCALELHNDQAIPAIVNLANTTTGRNRIYALKALELSGDNRAIPAFRAALDSPDEECKIVAIRALGNLNDQTVGRKLRTMLAAHPASLPLEMALYHSIEELRQNSLLPQK